MRPRQQRRDGKSEAVVSPSRLPRFTAAPPGGPGEVRCQSRFNEFKSLIHEESVSGGETVQDLLEYVTKHPQKCPGDEVWSDVVLGWRLFTADPMPRSCRNLLAHEGAARHLFLSPLHCQRAKGGWPRTRFPMMKRSGASMFPHRVDASEHACKKNK